ncbi:acyl-CoA synthetase [Ligilactobacillus salitolerans]|uniref:Acyl-CoA synthetase n=1 Tax=Ligilactobacillus salitolerans TaxID=1808352 RepID=A0A401ISB1_9LACO|nr:AMP-binding protein [Ligilactobacillus salitolerans]GBG94406.1 acyl-CoA synthetase [Ligilactobacillus salitolerans]
MSRLTESLNSQLEEQIDKKIIKDEAKDKWYTGNEIRQNVALLEQTLINQGVHAGDVLVIRLLNSANYAILLQAIWNLGAIAHPVAATMPFEQISEEMFHYHYRYLIVDSGNISHKQTFQATQLEKTDLILLQTGSTVPNQRQARSPKDEDLALIMNTSGTTGSPKRVGLSHGLLWHSAQHVIQSQNLTQADTVLLLMPLFHINAQVISLLATRLSRGKVVIAAKFSASHFWQQVSNDQITWASIVPTIIQILAVNENSLKNYSGSSSLKYLRSASFNLSQETYQNFERLFNIPILEGYGMTESASVIALNPLKAAKIGSVGLPIGTDVKIYTDAHQLTTEPGQVGEIALKGDHVILDYVDPNPQSFFHEWLLTGDIGYFDSDGYLFLTGRKREMINHGGEKIPPVEVEDVLNKMKSISESAVIGEADALYGEKVAAYVILQSTWKFDLAERRREILQYSQAHLPKYEQLADVHFVEDFPRNSTGKIQRTKLAMIMS